MRSGCGVFDVSHMGEIETRGPEAEAFLQRLLSNDVSKLEVGGAQYSCLCAADGGILDDLFTYRLADDRYLTVTNAANHEGDLARLPRHRGRLRGRGARRRCGLRDARRPGAARPAGSSAGSPAGELPPRMRTAEVEVAGVEMLVCGTGYTGEAGVELLIPPAEAAAVWSALLEAGADPGRARRPRHAAARGLLPPARQRDRTRPQPDRGRARLVLQGGDGLHRSGGDRRGSRRGHRPSG